MIAFMILAGLVLLLAGGEGLVRGGISFGRWMGLSPHVVGMVIVGFGTSMPELAVSLDAVRKGASGLAVGNVVGSNIANILLILPVAALILPIVRPSRVFMPDGLVLIASCVLVPIIGMQAGIIPRWQGGVMLAALAVLMAGEFYRSRREAADPDQFEEEPAITLPEELPQRPAIALLLTLCGLAAVIYGAELLVDGASQAARLMGVSEAFIGLTVVAIGTSLPELAGSGVAAWRGHSDVAYGNIVGSSIFNVLCILGATILVGPLTIPPEIVKLDAILMIGAALLMLLCVSTRRGLSRIEAVAMLALYFGYIALRYHQGAIGV